MLSKSSATLSEAKINYFRLNRIAKRKCQRNSILMFASGPLDSGFLPKLNDLYQINNIWAVFSRSQDLVSVHSVYSRLFELIEKNDFELTNMHYLGHTAP